MITQLQADVEAIARPGGRPVGSPGHLAARKYLTGRLASLGLKPYCGESFELPYASDGTQFTNLVASLPGIGATGGALLLGAHYDTCGSTPGADDNAAAVAIVLETVRILKQADCKRDVVAAIFDAEEPPYFLGPSMGSIHFYQHQRNAKIDCAYILDLVGHDVPMPGLENLLFITGMESHPDLAQVLMANPKDNRLRTAPTLNEYVGDMSDHHVFRTHEVPYLFFSCGHWQHYHQPTDTADRLNYAKMLATAQLLASIVIAIDSQALAKPATTYDSTPAELLLMNRALGSWLQGNGMRLLETRSDISAFAQRLHTAGL